MKKIITILLLVACSITTFGITEPIEVSAMTQLGKIKNFTYDYTSAGGVRFTWKKYCSADGYQLYRNNCKIKTIKARKFKLFYSCQDKMFDKQSNDSYYVNAYKIVRINGKKIRKVIAESKTVIFPRGDSSSGSDSGEPGEDNNVSFTRDGGDFIIKGTYEGKEINDRREVIKVDIRNSSFFDVRRNTFYGRKIIGINKDGYVLGPWMKITDTNSSADLLFYVPGEYIAFGYEFEIKGRNDLPYSNVFINYMGHDFLTTPHPNDFNEIKIETSGAMLIPTIEIRVDGQWLIHETIFNGYKPYPFEEETVNM